MIWLRAIRRRILDVLLTVVAVLGGLGVVVTVIDHVVNRRGLTLILGYYAAAFVIELCLLFARRMDDQLRAGLLVWLLYVFALFTFYTGWLGGSGRVFLMALVALAAVLIGPRTGLGMAVLSVATYFVFGLLYNRGVLVYPHAPLFSQAVIVLTEGLGLMLAVGMVAISLWYMKAALDAADQAFRQTQVARQQVLEQAGQLNEANRLLAERTANLEAANRELEAFSYSVSHDLRAPLRAIDSFTRLLVSDYADGLDAQGQQFLARILANASQMNRLIDDLLLLSRLGRKPFERQAVDMTALAQAVVAELAPAYPSELLEVTVGELPLCQADPALARQVLVNLVDNALKYSSKRSPARVEIGWAAQDGQGAYYVRDNGVGFDMAYADKLFGLFQRLHGMSEFPGTGVGLAIVHKLVQRHGGRVWAAAAPDAGATFYFTLQEQA
jgi:signal transduction histidine kinase